MLMFRDAMVERKKWLTKEEFQEIVTITAVLPGPNLVNFSAYFGYKFFGNFGAFCGVLLLCLPGAVMGLLVLWFVPLVQPDVQRLFQGFSIGSVVLYVVFIARLLPGLRTQHAGVSASRLKFILRAVLTVAIATMIILNVPFFVALISGLVFCLFVEFLT